MVEREWGRNNEVQTHGPLGTVGNIDVDIETGELNVSADCMAEIQHCAQELAARISPQTAPAG